MGVLIPRMQKMTSEAPDYFRYFAMTPAMKSWGLGVTAAGRTRVAPGAVYPSDAHPEDHRLDWEQGRVLESLQVVLIREGGGWLETKAGGTRWIGAGMAFLLFPGAWHRYRPDAETGWRESWVEVQGPVVANLIRNGHLQPERHVMEHAIPEGIEELLERVHLMLLAEQPAPPPLLAAAALEILARCSLQEKGASSSAGVDHAVARAVRHLAEHHAEPVNMEELARSLGVAYSHFRRAFRRHTGLPPWKYVIQLRLNRARRLLVSGDATLEEIAIRVGFGSAFHLSHAFKKAYGIAPDPWRRKQARGK